MWQLADPNALLDAAVVAAENLADKKGQKGLLQRKWRRRPISIDWFLERISYLRGFVIKKAREQVW